MHNKNTLISLRNVSVEFDGTRVLDKINLDIGDKEFVTLLGPSGCGKTTTLRIIGGFVEPTEGDVFFDGQKINGLPPHKRHVNTVFQRYALFPHLNVYENVEFGLKISKIPEEERRKKMCIRDRQRRVCKAKCIWSGTGEQRLCAVFYRKFLS